MGEHVTIGDYQEEFHPVISTWCDSHRVETPSEEDLASAVGVMAYCADGVLPMGCGFIYVSGNLAFVEGLVMKPGLSIREARETAEIIYQSLREKALLSGVSKLVAFVKSKGMVRECERVGFSQCGPPMVQMVQQLN